MADARRIVERVARTSYGRLIAYLAAQTRDIAAAEDALADAFQAALRSWPERGIPDRPEAWLLTAARRAAGHVRRHGAVHDRAQATIAMIEDEKQAASADGLPDQRLKLLFICAHPAIPEAVRTPLMLQTVLGLDAARIASAFLLAPAAMGQRLVRAKAKIRDAGLRFEEPDGAALTARLPGVLAAVYAAYGSAWDVAPGAQGDGGLGEEAIYLARLLVDLLPAEPEAKGLLALLLYCEARRDARRNADGAFVPLPQQDRALWSRALIEQAEALLTDASKLHRPGRYQTEAAIQSLHITGASRAGRSPHPLLLLYDVLARQAPVIGVLVARAAAHGEITGPAAGLALLDAVDAERTRSHQPYWAVRGHLLAALGNQPAALAAFDRAIGLADDPAIGAYLLGCRDRAAAARPAEVTPRR